MTIIIPIIKTKTYCKKVMNQWPHLIETSNNCQSLGNHHHHGNLLSKSHDNVDGISKSLQSIGDLLVHRKGSAPNRLHEENSFLPDDDHTSYFLLHKPNFPKKLLKCTFFALKVYNFSSKI